jgi:uncharacterized paraquat-inducible protein A
MDLTYECPQCEAVGRVDRVEAASAATCPRCQAVRALSSQALAEDGSLVACPWCATEDMYIQKDFPHVLGLAIVVTGFAMSTVFWFFYRPVLAFAVLLATAAVDLLLYYLVPDVTICYRCLGQCRGPGSNPDGRFQPFDLSIGERYRQERLRVEELRRRGAGAPADGG